MQPDVIHVKIFLREIVSQKFPAWRLYGEFIVKTSGCPISRKLNQFYNFWSCSPYRLKLYNVLL